jgi:hypothetical protein
MSCKKNIKKIPSDWDNSTLNNKKKNKKNGSNE